MGLLVAWVPAGEVLVKDFSVLVWLVWLELVELFGKVLELVDSDQKHFRVFGVSQPYRKNCD